MGLFSGVLEGETFATMTLVFCFLGFAVGAPVWTFGWFFFSLCNGFFHLFPKKRKKTLAFVEV
jgi:hypothetical protein